MMERLEKVVTQRSFRKGVMFPILGRISHRRVTWADSGTSKDGDKVRDSQNHRISGYQTGKIGKDFGNPRFYHW